MRRIDLPDPSGRVAVILQAETRARSKWMEWSAVVLGLWSAAVALAPTMNLKLALIAPLFAGAAFPWLLSRPNHWLLVFFPSLLLLPPLPLPFGDNGVHIAPIFVLFGLIVSLASITHWERMDHPVISALLWFWGILTASVAFAALYSGWAVAAGSLARVVLFSISLFVFLFSYAGPQDSAWNVLRITRVLFAVAFVGAVFACADFYFQFPTPAGYGEQFVYLEEGIFRRAQGLFYEASTLGNFCAFFLVMVMVCSFRRREHSPLSRLASTSGVIVFAGALLLSYSRASILNVLFATAVLIRLRFGGVRRIHVNLLIALIVAGGAFHLMMPALSANYWGRLMGSFSFFDQSPDQVLSGRLSHWQTLIDFLAERPWHAIFGIGYKTLPYSTFVGSSVIADNTYLDLLVETGVLGVASFVWLNVMILRTGWRALQSSGSRARFYGEWIFCFWCGELVQMFSGDLITYWRVLPVYFWVLGTAARETRRAQ